MADKGLREGDDGSRVVTVNYLDPNVNLLDLRVIADRYRSTGYIDPLDGLDVDERSNEFYFSREEDAFGFAGDVLRSKGVSDVNIRTRMRVGEQSSGS